MPPRSCDASEALLPLPVGLACPLGHHLLFLSVLLPASPGPRPVTATVTHPAWMWVVCHVLSLDLRPPCSVYWSGTFEKAFGGSKGLRQSVAEEHGGTGH